MSQADRQGVTAVLLLRHAATHWNEQQRRLGWVDHPLAPAGRRAAREWAGLVHPRPEVVFCSDLRRARETAWAIAEVLELHRVDELSGLREQDQGDWTGLTKQQIRARWPGRARERPPRPVRGEAPQAVLGRALLALRAIGAAHPGRRVLAITHSQVIRVLEHAISAPAPPVPYLQGRWVTVTPDARLDAAGAARWVRAGALTTARAEEPEAGSTTAGAA